MAWGRATGAVGRFTHGAQRTVTLGRYRRTNAVLRRVGTQPHALQKVFDRYQPMAAVGSIQGLLRTADRRSLLGSKRRLGEDGAFDELGQRFILVQHRLKARLGFGRHSNGRKIGGAAHMLGRV